MSANPPPVECVINARTHSVCKCGARIDMGSATVVSGGIRIVVGLSATGVTWPHEVTLPKEIADVLEPQIRSAWLGATGEQWELAAAKGVVR